MTLIRDSVRPFGLAGGLLFRFWPQLLLIGALGVIARDLLLEAAVAVGFAYPLGGMVVLSSVVLVELLVIVTMFAALRPGLPVLQSLREDAGSIPDDDSRRRRADRTLALAAAAILPFFAYYAAWGFLGDTIREYSRLALDRVGFGERLQVFELLRSTSLIASILACWAVRWLAQRMTRRSDAPAWRFLLVAADASWIFIGLYALGRWKDDFITWLGAGALLDELSSIWPDLSIAAHAAAGFVPVEFRPLPFEEQARGLFFYALLPLVWLVLAAIVYGYDLSARTVPATATPARASTWPKWLDDFAAHFLGGYRSRYRPVWTCLRMVLGTGAVGLAAFIVAYRAIGWAGAWAWYAATRHLGPYDLDTWQLVAGVLAVFIGSPSDLDGGILLDAARIALLAAVLEHAVSAGRRDASALAPEPN